MFVQVSNIYDSLSFSEDVCRYFIIYSFPYRAQCTEDPRYNDSVCYHRFCCEIEFAVIKKLDVDPSKA